MWKSFFVPPRVAAADEQNTSQASAEFLAVVTSDSIQSAGAASSQLKYRFLKFVPRRSRANKNAAGDKQESNSVGKDADAVAKQAWPDPTPRSSGMTAVIPAEVGTSDEVAIDRRNVQRSVRLDTPANDSVMIRRFAGVRADEGFDFVRIAQEAGLILIRFEGLPACSGRVQGEG